MIGKVNWRFEAGAEMRLWRESLVQLGEFAGRWFKGILREVGHKAGSYCVCGATLQVLEKGANLMLGVGKYAGWGTLKMGKRLRGQCATEEGQGQGPMDQTLRPHVRHIS